MSEDIHPQVKKLLELPQHEQRSEEWYNQREQRLTASDVASAIGLNKYKSRTRLLIDKSGFQRLPYLTDELCKVTTEMKALQLQVDALKHKKTKLETQIKKIGEKFTGNDATEWGQKYEDEAIMIFEQTRNKKNINFGLIPHPEYDWLGGSPDGITTDGILLEIKCPLRRPIKQGVIPEYYLPQVQLNLEICDLEEAVFIEYKPKELTKGDYEINFVDIKRDREWFKKYQPLMKSFWDDVLYYREHGIETHPTMDKNTIDISPDSSPKKKKKFGKCIVEE